MKYDDASWHYGGKFPKDLPDTAGATHTGMFLAWALLNGLAGDIHLHDVPEMLEGLKAREVTPGAFFLQACDGKLTDEDLNDEGNNFAQGYFVFETGAYLSDYERVLSKGLPSVYHVPDTWDSFDKLAPVITARFNTWKKAADKKG